VSPPRMSQLHGQALLRLRGVLQGRRRRALKARSAARNARGDTPDRRTAARSPSHA
jgi:hypothetical protein